MRGMHSCRRDTHRIIRVHRCALNFCVPADISATFISVFTIKPRIGNDIITSTPLPADGRNAIDLEIRLQTSRVPSKRVLLPRPLFQRISFKNTPFRFVNHVFRRGNEFSNKSIYIHRENILANYCTWK